MRTRKTSKRTKGRPPGRPSRSAGKRRSSKRTRNGKSRTVLGGLVYWGSVLGIWALIALGGVLAYVTLTMPADVMANIKLRPPNVTLVGSDGTVLAERGLRRGYIRLKHMPRHLIDAVLATEDRRFRAHFGIDPIGLMRAMVKNAKAGTIVEGGSTITQQLAKNLFLTPERTVTRKMQEVVLAFWLETQLSKNEILESYLNRVYFGAGTHGVEAAAKRYFGKSARNVTVAEAALLAGLLKAPSKYAPTRNPRLAEQRASIVIANMVDAELLTSKQAMAAISEPAEVRNPSGITGYEYAADWVVEILPRLLGAEHRSDVIVETTIDPVLQREAQRIVSQTLDSHSDRVNANQAAALVLDTGGGVKAIVGGRSYRESQYNRVIRSRRQPGSAFKPFVYLAALESGLTPDTLVRDAPLNINGWRPKNYKNKYRGRITMREALANSVNTVAVRLTLEAGRWRVARTARRLGIESDIQKNLSIALGTSEVTLLELVSAYAPFANGGYIATPHIVNRIQTSEGKILYQRRTTGRPRAVALPYVAAMNDMMSATMVAGTARRAALTDRPAAGKTGTTQNFRDAWFVGYTAHYVAGVWIGNDDSKPMKRVTGGSLPAGMWKDIMLTAHRQTQAASLPGGRQPALAQSRAVTDQPQKNKRSLIDRVLGVLSPNS
ncbi:MAG: PBP1A family penicillin-binding protein [Hyphomicrobiaceae bacterium]|nr:PBP1A family penicillin-binding protein [Hyphomicrobiaceae bacterium]